MAGEVNVTAGEIHLIVGRVEGKLDSRLEKSINEKGLDLAGIINSDDDIYEMDLEGGSVFDLPEDSKALLQMRGLLEKIGVL